MAVPVAPGAMMGYAMTVVRFDAFANASASPDRTGAQGTGTQRAGTQRKVWEEPGVVEELTRLAAAGHSATVIARSINEAYQVEPPMSRCAVIGKCSRMGISLSVKPLAALKDSRPREPRLVSVKPLGARSRSPSEALLALPSTVPPGGIPISKAHRDSLILAAKAHDRWHQSLVDRETALDEVASRDGDLDSVPAALPYPETSRGFWAEQAPKTFMDVRMPGECSYVTARSKGNETHYCGLDAGDGRSCRWHKRLCYIPR